MSRKLIIRLSFAVIIALVIVIFYLMSKTYRGEWVFAIILTLFMGEAYLLIPKKWFARFKRKEKNPLID